MGKLTYSLFGIVAVMGITIYFGSSTIQSLSVTVGGLEIKLEKAISETEAQKKLYSKEQKAVKLMKKKNSKLEKEIINEKIKFERAFSGTTIIG